MQLALNRMVQKEMTEMTRTATFRIYPSLRGANCNERRAILGVALAPDQNVLVAQREAVDLVDLAQRSKAPWTKAVVVAPCC